MTFQHLRIVSREVRFIHATAMCAVIAAVFACVPAAALNDRVENVRFEQRGEKIYVVYDLEGPGDWYEVSLKLSSSGGAEYDIVPRTVRGDVGPGVRPGLERVIVWEAAVDAPGLHGEDFVFAVTAREIQDPGSVEGGAACPYGMALVPRGVFTMGCSSGDSSCFDDEKPPREVAVTHSFCLDETEVTQDSFRGATGANPSFFKGCGGLCPVENVTWYEADSYCKSLGKRLPTEAEWEYAARAGSVTRYPWGREPDERYAWFAQNSGDTTHPAASRRSNKFGLYDMSGNVWEWVQDCADATWYVRMPQDDPVNAAVGCTQRVLRGGSWVNPGPILRVSYRHKYAPGESRSNFGFRCAADPH